MGIGHKCSAHFRGRFEQYQMLKEVMRRHTPEDKAQWRSQTVSCFAIEKYLISRKCHYESPCFYIAPALTCSPAVDDICTALSTLIAGS
jgi:hypothetical protein